MTPDRMVVAEAMRTFTYLNLYGYLTDAVVVNRVFPEEVDGKYFGAWRALQAEQLGCVRVRLRAPCRCCARRTSSTRWSARRCSTASAARCSPTATRRPCCTTGSPRSCAGRRPRASCGSTCRSRARATWRCKKIGLELVVRVDGQKRTIVLPGALAGFRPTSARARGRLAGRGVRGSERRPVPERRSTTRARPSGWCARRAQAAAERGRGAERAAARLGRPRGRATARPFPDLAGARRRCSRRCATSSRPS